MVRPMLQVVVVAAVTAATVTGAAGAVVPANGGDGGGMTITISSAPGEQLDPHVSSDLAAYVDTDAFPSGRFTTTTF